MPWKFGASSTVPDEPMQEAPYHTATTEEFTPQADYRYRDVAKSTADAMSLPLAFVPGPVGVVAGGYMALRGLQDAADPEKSTTERVIGGAMGLPIVGASVRGLRNVVKGGKALKTAEGLNSAANAERRIGAVPYPGPKPGLVDPVKFFNPQTSSTDLLDVLGSRYRALEGLGKTEARLSGKTLQDVGKIVDPKKEWLAAQQTATPKVPGWNPKSQEIPYGMPASERATDLTSALDELSQASMLNQSTRAAKQSQNVGGITTRYGRKRPFVSE